jgi:hypothetical protein
MSAKSGEVVIRQATPSDVLAFSHKKTVFSIAYVEDKPIAMAGFLRAHGRLWASFDVKRGARGHGVRLVLALRKGLAAAGEPVFIQRKTKRAKRLLRVLGFAPTGETMNDLEVWKCPA